MSGGVERSHDELVAILYCSDCGREVAHRVAYRGDAVLKTVCSRCGRTLTARRRRAQLCDDRGGARRGARRRVGALALELPKRAVTKPGRLWREMRREGVGVLLTMPRRVATKPVRLVAELTGVAGRRGVDRRGA